MCQTLTTAKIRFNLLLLTHHIPTSTLPSQHVKSFEIPIPALWLILKNTSVSVPLGPHCNANESELVIESHTWKMLAPYGVLQAFSRLSFPVLTNHLPSEQKHQELMWGERTHLCTLAALKGNTQMAKDRSKVMEAFPFKAPTSVLCANSLPEQLCACKKGNQWKTKKKAAKRYNLMPYRSRRIWGRARSSHAGVAGICLVWCGGEPPRCCSPSLQPTTRQSDSNPERRSAKVRSQVVVLTHHTLTLTFLATSFRIIWESSEMSNI